MITSCVLLVLFHEGTLNCKLSKFLLLQAGDLILADKGFVIHDILPKNVFLNMPAFLSGRIHVERAIERLRNYKILGYINGHLRPFTDMIVQVCAALVNLQTPIIAGIFQEYQAGITSSKDPIP